jgi:hypothetical protein
VHIHVVSTVLQNAAELPVALKSFYECAVDKACTFVCHDIDYHQLSIIANWGGGDPGQINRARRSGRGPVPGPDYVT